MLNVLALSLFVPWVDAENIHLSVASNNFAVFAAWFD